LGSKSAEKRVRASQRKRLRNKSIRSQNKTFIIKAENVIFSGELDTAQESVKTAIKSLDKAAEKGVIHQNNAARRKSRLMKKLNEALASSFEQEPAAEAEPQAEETQD